MSKAAARKHLAQAARKEARERGLSGERKASLVRQARSRIPLSEVAYDGIRAPGGVIHYPAPSSLLNSRSWTPPTKPKVEIPFDVALQIAKVAFPRGDDFDVPDGLIYSDNRASNVTQWPREFIGGTDRGVTYDIPVPFGSVIHLRRDGETNCINLPSNQSLAKAHKLVKEARKEFAKLTEGRGTLSSASEIVVASICIGTLAGFLIGVSLNASGTLATLGSTYSGNASGLLNAG